MTATSQMQKIEPLVSVTGEGKVNVVPDGVAIKMRVESQGKDAQQVKLENDQAIDRVLKMLRAQGVDSKEVQSEYINLNKNYDHKTKVYNYNANQTLLLKLKDLSKYEVVMSELLNSGINRIDNVRFTSSKMVSLQAEARIKAITDAKEKATAYAAALGQSIGKAVQISEMGSNAPQPVSRARMMSAPGGASSGESIAPGELTVTSKISVSFELK